MERRITRGIAYTAGRWPLDPATSTIVFVHGAGGTGDFWEAQVRGLAERANTVAVDLPGHGRSGGHGETQIGDYARTIVDLISRIKIPNPILCGLSMGGAIAQQLLLDYPAQMRAGILIATGARLKVAPVIFETIENDFNAFVDMVVKLAASPKSNPEVIQRFKIELAGCNPRVAHGDFQACNRFDVLERLPAIDSPVLVLSAQDDKLTPPRYADTLEKDIRNASRTHIMDAGHIVPAEKPLQVNQAILEFLDRYEL